MSNNDFLPFAASLGANVETQAAYVADSLVLANGFLSGVASSAKLNKVWRQSSIIAAVMAQFSADYSGNSSNDDGTTATLETSLAKAIRSAASPTLFDTGVANVYVAAFTPALAAPIPGAPVWVKILNANTSASTINLTGTAYPLLGGAHSALQGGEMIAGGWALVVWNATLTSYVLVECTGGALQIPSGSYGVTPNQFDLSTKLATMAALQRVGLSANGFNVLIASTTLTAALHAGSTVAISSVSATTQTLPANATVPAGVRMEFWNGSTGVTTIARAGTDTINMNGATSITSVSLGIGDTLTLESNGTGTWFAVGGSAQLAYSSLFASSLAPNGSQKLPGGYIRQWGTVVTNASGLATFTFQSAFPNAIYGVTTGSNNTQSIVVTWQAPALGSVTIQTWTSAGAVAASCSVFVEVTGK